VFDPTIGYSKEQADKLGIEITPFIIGIDDNLYIDDNSLDKDLILNDIHSKKLVSWSQPNVSDTIGLFQEILKSNDYIIYFTIAQSISGTYNAGVLAAREIGLNKVRVVDIKSGFGLSRYLLTKLKQLVQSNSSIQEMVDEASSLVYSSASYLIFNDLESFSDFNTINSIKKTLYQTSKTKFVLKMKTNGDLTCLSRSTNYENLINRMILDATNQDILKESSIMYLSYYQDNDLVNKIKDKVRINYPNIKIEELPFNLSFALEYGSNAIVVQFIKEDK